MENLIKTVLVNLNKMKQDLLDNSYFPNKSDLDAQSLKRGLELSKTTCAQQPNVFVTPWMKNAMIIHGDVKQVKNEKGEWSTEKFPIGKNSKAVKWFNDVVTACLKRFNSAGSNDYSETCSITDLSLYDSDCWNGWKPTIFDIVEGQADQRKDMFKAYRVPKTNLSIDQMKQILLKDNAVKKAVQELYDVLPTTICTKKVTKINEPFMNKKTGVSYPFYHNDSAIVPGTNRTYGKMLIDLVQSFFDKGISYVLKMIKKYNVATGYPRNQRGKGRALEALSRVVNLILNVVNSYELEQWKQSSVLGVPFLPEPEFKEALITRAKLCETAGLDCHNVDFSKWDYNLGAGWVSLQNAVRYEKCRDNNSRLLVLARNAVALKTMFVDGPNNSVNPIYGRVFSGYIDTTVGNTAGSRLVATSILTEMDEKYFSQTVTPMKGLQLLTLGDDVWAAHKKTDNFLEKFSKVASRYGTIVHSDEKHARGLMFLQWRLCKDRNGNYIMAYNWPRVLRSMLSKEESKGLGKAGWILSAYQQLGKLIEYPEMCSIVFNIIASLDKDRLMVDRPIQEIIDLCKKEDMELMSGVSDRKKSRLTSTPEKLFNANPTLRGVIVGNGGQIEIEEGYFDKIQKVLKSVNNPNFLPSLGFGNPNLKLVK